MPTNDDLCDPKKLTPLLRSLKKEFSAVRFHDGAKDLLLKQCASESWFSDALAWLLDPKGSHGLQSAFADAFLDLVASCGHQQREEVQKARKNGKRRGARQFNVGNAAIIREFFIADLSDVARRSRGYCDVVLLDLDSKDSIILVIENKLFTTNTKDQLSDYYNAVQKRYKSVRTKEFVYLTLFGTAPVGDQEDAAIRDPEWVRVSWCDDILKILRECAGKRAARAEVKRLIKVLEWIDKTRNVRTDSGTLRETLLDAGTRCVHGALQDRCVRGKWEVRTNGNQKTTTRTLIHTSNPTRRLHVRLLPNLTVVVAGERRKFMLFPKVIIPFGAHPRQVKNLINLAGDAISESYFSKSNLYHRGPTASSLELDRRWKDVAPVFKFTHDYAAPIQILMAALAGWSADPDADELTASEALIERGDVAGSPTP